jgi:hypothetical protein
MPGIGELIDGAMQQAPHPGRQANGGLLIFVDWMTDGRTRHGLGQPAMIAARRVRRLALARRLTNLLECHAIISFK